MILTERRGSKAVRLLDNCSILSLGGRLFPRPTVAIFKGSPALMRNN